MFNVLIAKCAASLLGCVGLLLASPAWADDDVIVAVPITNWTLDADGETCGLQRIFEGDEKRFVLEMRRYWPGAQNSQFVIASADIGIPGSRDYRKSLLRFLPDDEAKPIFGAYGMRWGSEARGITFSAYLDQRNILHEEERTPERAVALDALMPERERAIVGIELQRVFREDIRLETGSLEQPMIAMRSCLDDLLPHWGVDAEAHKTRSRGVKRLNFDEFAQAVAQAYPGPAERRGEVALLRVRLSISADGSVSACNIQDQYGDDAFRESACEIILSDARYEPALDAEGNPIASFDHLSIHYRLN